MCGWFFRTDHGMLRRLIRGLVVDMLLRIARLVCLYLLAGGE